MSRVVAFGRDLPDQLRTQFKTNPVLVVAAVGGASFILGAIFGSKLGRLALGAAIPYAIKRILDGDLGREVEQFAKDLVGGEGEAAG